MTAAPGKQKHERHNDRFRSISAVLTLVLICTTWIGGFLRMQDNELVLLSRIHPSLDRIQKVDEGVFSACRKGSDCAGEEDRLFIAVAGFPSYGAPLKLAVVANGLKKIEHISILRNSDTGTFIRRIMEAGIPGIFLGKDITALPDVDAVSSATISSTAIMRCVEKGSAVIAQKRFGIPQKTPSAPLMTQAEGLKLLLLAAFFAAAPLVGSRWYRWKKVTAILVLAVLSVAVLGFGYGMQFSLATIAGFLSLSWLQGIASFAPLLCLAAAVTVFVTTKKNYYCTMICPYGCMQECLSRITSCSPPVVHPAMKWCSRYVALLALCAALYFRNPSLATYEPFGQTFSFIGSTLLFALAFLVILASLFVKRPWCRLLCPMTPFFDYLQFIKRQWVLKEDKGDHENMH